MPGFLGFVLQEVAMTDLTYVVGVVAFLVLTWGLVRLCEKVQ
jgi:hypothetical protein